MNKNVLLLLFVLLALGVVGFVLMDSSASSRNLLIQEQSGASSTKPLISYQNIKKEKRSGQNSSSSFFSSTSTATALKKSASSFTSMHTSSAIEAKPQDYSTASDNKPKESSIEVEPRQELPITDQAYRSFYSKKTQNIKRLKEELPPPPPSP